VAGGAGDGVAGYDSSGGERVERRETCGPGGGGGWGGLTGGGTVYWCGAPSFTDWGGEEGTQRMGRKVTKSLDIGKLPKGEGDLGFTKTAAKPCGC